MQISRKIAHLLSSCASQSRKWGNLWTEPVLRSSASTVSAKIASPRKNTKASNTHLQVTESAANTASQEVDPVKIVLPARDVPKLWQIPWQPMVANSVNLIGYLGAPVQLGISSNDMHTGVSILVNEKNLDLPQIRIPIIFRGHLAQIAACNLRENDRVLVTGQLAGSVGHDAQGVVQVLVNSISYVVEVADEKECENSSEEYESSAVEHEDSAAAPDISSVSEKKFDSLSKTRSSWVDLLENPEQWIDNRERKHNGKVKPNFPDFIHKSTETPLWLVAAPEWVHSRLASPKAGPLKAYVQSEFRAGWKTRQEIEELWKDLFGNPQKWLDKRLCKMKPNYPDFKRKDTGDALWIGSSTTPSWVHGKLLTLRVSELSSSWES